MRPWLVLAALAACSGERPADIDANPAGPMCNKATYDLCIEEHDCTTGLCHNFSSEGFQVCTQGCDPANSCPNDKSGSPGTCNNLGICQPSAPNMCHL
jgi:hypothetical protein